MSATLLGALVASVWAALAQHPHGFVRLETGEAVPGATIVAVSLLGGEEDARETTSGPGGGWWLELPKGDWLLHAELAGRTDSEPLLHQSSLPGTRHDLVFPEGRTVSGRVADAQGLPIRGALVEALPAVRRPGQPAHAALVTTEDGAFALSGLPRDASLELRARAAGWCEASIELPPGSEDAERSLVLRPAGRLEGRVVAAESGEPLGDVEVRLLRRELPANDETRQQLVGGAIATPAWRVASAQPDVSLGDGGRFEASVPAGEDLRLEISAPGRLASVSDAVRAESGATVDTGVHRLERGRDLVGVVVDALSGEPVAGASVWSFDSEERRVLTDADGRFRLEGLPAGPVQVRAEHADYPADRRHRVLLDDFTSEAVELRLWPGGRLLVTALGHSGRPIAEARVCIDGTGHPAGRCAFANSVGVARFERVERGRRWATLDGPITNIHVALAGGAESSAWKRVEIEDGETAEIVLKATGVALTGRILRGGAPFVGAAVEHRRLGARAFYPLSAEAPKTPLGTEYRLEGLEPGTWLLAVKAPLMGEHGLRWVNSPIIEVRIPEGRDRWQADLEVPADWPESEAGEPTRVIVPGRVVDEGDGAAVGGVLVMSACNGSHVTDPAGRFELSCPGEGELELSVWRTRQQGSKTHGLELVEPVRLLVEEGRVLSPVLPLELRVRQGPRRDIQVVDAASRPVAGARLTLVSLQGQVSPFGTAVQTGPAGDAVLVGGEAGAHDLIVATPGRGWSVLRDVEIPGDGPLTVALPVPGRVRIQEPGSWRLGPPGLPWWVRDSAHRWLGMVTEITDGIEWLVPPGRWVVSDGGERQWSLEVDSGELSLLPPVADEEGP